jgi:hypothetical protein
MIAPLLTVIALACVLYLGFVVIGWSVWLIVAAICLLVVLLLGFYPLGPAAPWSSRRSD